MNARTLIKCALLLTGLSIAVAGFNTAFAKAVPAAIGRTTEPEFQDRVSTEWNLGLFNHSGTTRTIIFPLVVDNAENQTVYVSAYGTWDDDTVGCVAVGHDFHGNSIWYTGWAYLTSFGSPQTLSLGSVYVPPMGRLHVVCEVASGGHVNTIVYNPG